MDDAQLIGYAVLAIITLGSFITLINKFTQPINDLRVVIQKLNDTIDNLKKENETTTKRLDKHGDEIETLDKRVGKLETRVDMYHNGGK